MLLLLGSLFSFFKNDKHEVIDVKCLICGENENFGCAVCKVCGMHTKEPVIYDELYFCSEKCLVFFRNISEKSPQIADRDIIF